MLFDVVVVPLVVEFEGTTVVVFKMLGKIKDGKLIFTVFWARTQERIKQTRAIMFILNDKT